MKITELLRNCVDTFTARRKSFTKTELAGLPPPLRGYVEDYTEAVPLQEVFGERLEETIVTGWQQTQVPEVPMVSSHWRKPGQYSPLIGCRCASSGPGSRRRSAAARS